MLAAVGVYGVTAHMVAQQTNEIGIRMAIGADRMSVIRPVLRRVFQRVAAGLVVGLPVAVGAARLLAAQLYGVSFWDPVALTVAAGSVAGCAIFAAIVPAGRAAAISPMRHAAHQVGDRTAHLVSLPGQSTESTVQLHSSVPRLPSVSQN